MKLSLAEIFGGEKIFFAGARAFADSEIYLEVNICRIRVLQHET